MNKEIQGAMNQACKESGLDASFGTGFKKGVEYAQENNEKSTDLAIDEALEDQEDDLKKHYEEKIEAIKELFDSFLIESGALPVPENMEISEYLKMYFSEDIKKAFGKSFHMVSK